MTTISLEMYVRSRLGDGWHGCGNDIGAVNEILDILAGNSELGHGSLEIAHHQLLVVY